MEIELDSLLNDESNLGFHFCNTVDLYPNDKPSKLDPNQNSRGIVVEGLIPSNTGALSSASSTEQPAVFFSLGFKGTLGYMNRLLIRISRFQELIDNNPSYVNKFFKEELELYKEIKNDPNWVYIIANKYLERLSYIVLSLNGVTKEEYESMDDNSNIDYIIDDIDNATGVRQTPRNMHTLVGKRIEPTKIRKIEGSAIDILIRMFDLYKTKYPDSNYLDTEAWENRTIKTDLLTGFIEYEKRLKENNEIRLI
ncbi:MAG: hypothetical protein IKP76_03220 [Bacilli bacterium]|nr:hypothetical protein [Bacilli bacterium]